MKTNVPISGQADAIQGDEPLIWTVPEHIRQDYLAR